MYVSGPVIRRLGGVRCLYVVAVAYTVRFVSYSLIPGAWFVLPVELLHGVTYGLLMPTVTSYGSPIIPPEMSATIQGIIGGLFDSLGKYLSYY
jgi:MFS family permease